MRAWRSWLLLFSFADFLLILVCIWERPLLEGFRWFGANFLLKWNSFGLALLSGCASALGACSDLGWKCLFRGFGFLRRARRARLRSQILNLCFGFGFCFFKLLRSLLAFLGRFCNEKRWKILKRFCAYTRIAGRLAPTAKILKSLLCLMGRTKVCSHLGLSYVKYLYYCFYHCLNVHYDYYYYYLILNRCSDSFCQWELILQIFHRIKIFQTQKVYRLLLNLDSKWI